MIDFDYWSPTYIAIGGGSVIDSSKAIAIGAANGGEWRRFYVGKEVKVRPVIPAALPVGVVLTIAAAGSEGSTNSIINLEPENLKRGAGGDILRPKFAILNPELTMTLPPFQTACGLADMFAHLCERYFSPTRDVTLTDNLCEAVMRTVVEESAKVMADPSDYQARANVMWAGTLAHNDICGAGRVQDWASHGIEHELSALYDCAHGAGLAVVMPAWMTYVYKTDPARFARFARNVFGVGHGAPDTDAALAGIAAFRKWLKSLGLPLTFAGVREPHLLVGSDGARGCSLGGPARTGGQREVFGHPADERHLARSDERRQPFGHHDAMRPAVVRHKTVDERLFFSRHLDLSVNRVLHVAPSVLAYPSAPWRRAGQRSPPN